MPEAPACPRQTRVGLEAIAPVAHGSAAAAELGAAGLSLADVLDFSVNTNPLGPAPSVLAAVRQTDWSRYPGDDDAPLRHRIAAHCGVDVHAVALGNGSAELLWLLALAVLSPGDRVAVLGPTFGEYVRAAQVVGAQVQQVPEPHGLAADTRVLVVCNPNNPTGRYLAQADVARLLDEAPERLLVLDEAYAAFAPARWASEPLLARYPNLVILRSMTKDHAVPGLRLGYLLASPEVASAVEAVRPPWSVNAGALRAGLAALEAPAQAHLARGVEEVQQARALLTSGLRQLGYELLPSAANFVLVRVGDATAFRRRLLRRGLVVRDCTSFGLPAHVRIACRRPDECQRLLDGVAALAESAVSEEPVAGGRDGAR